jgi:hypothetical protein
VAPEVVALAPELSMASHPGVDSYTMVGEEDFEEQTLVPSMEHYAPLSKYVLTLYL